MFEPATVELLTSINESLLRSLLSLKQVRIWGVFLLCLFFSAFGVFLSLWLLGTVIKGTQLWGFGFVIAVTMLGISYGAKYANADARERFTPVDLIQYLTQGFLWPSTWPALAEFLGIHSIGAPAEEALLWQELTRAVFLA